MKALSSRRQSRWPSRAWWLALLVVIGPAGTTVGMAASLSLSSANLTVVRTCVLTAASSTSPVAIDSGVQQASATSNFGTASSANVTSQSPSKNTRIYLKFDLSQCRPAIPTSATVTLATLRLYPTAIPIGTACRTHDLFKVGASWTETGITWNNQPFGPTVNNPATGTRTDAFTVGPSSAGCQNTATGQYVTGWNVTADVQTFVATPSTNFGWMIRDDAEDSGVANTTYSMREHSSGLVQGPQLILTYKT